MYEVIRSIKYRKLVFILTHKATTHTHTFQINFFVYTGSYSERAYNDVSALICYNLRYAYYRILEIKTRFYQEKRVLNMNHVLYLGK